MQSIRDQYPALFGAAIQTMQQFIWQLDIVSVAHFVMDCFDVVHPISPDHQVGHWFPCKASEMRTVSSLCLCICSTHVAHALWSARVRTSRASSRVVTKFTSVLLQIFWQKAASRLLLTARSSPPLLLMPCMICSSFFSGSARVGCNGVKQDVADFFTELVCRWAASIPMDPAESCCVVSVLLLQQCGTAAKGVTADLAVHHHSHTSSADALSHHLHDECAAHLLSNICCRMYCPEAFVPGLHLPNLLGLHALLEDAGAAFAAAALHALIILFEGSHTVSEVCLCAGPLGARTMDAQLGLHLLAASSMTLCRDRHAPFFQPLHSCELAALVEPVA